MKLLLLCFWVCFVWVQRASAFRPPSSSGLDGSKKGADISTDMAPSLLIPLTTSTVEQAIDEATASDLSKQLQETKKIRVERIKDWQVTLDELKIAAPKNFVATKTPWYFGLAITDAETNQLVDILTFYVAYSSWNGRILYVDRLDCNGDEDTEQLLLRLLGQIAWNLDCARITWRHTTIPDWHSTGANQPEMHGEVLTLSMDQAAMTNFLSDSPLSGVQPIQGVFDKALVDTAFDHCLETINSHGSPFRLRRVHNKAELETMSRLVQGLADYCEESDAVHMEANDYIQDGLDLNNPLWYCLLVDKEGKDGKPNTCGYAFFFAGYIMGQGRFLYLEDLFLEVEHRGGGGGSVVMKTLAGLCQALGCSRLYWQALDWNSAGLSFYDKIGAKVHPGEKTSRYAGDALELFAKAEW